MNTSKHLPQEQCTRLLHIQQDFRDYQNRLMFLDIALGSLLETGSSFCEEIRNGIDLVFGDITDGFEEAISDLNVLFNDQTERGDA